MQRVVTAELDLDLGSSVDLIFQITAAQGAPLSREQLTFTQGDRVYTPTEIVDQSGSRLHRLTGESGTLAVRYEATVDELLRTLTPANHALAAEIAALPERIRGFGHVKLRSMKSVAGREAELLDAYRNPKPAPAVSAAE